MTVLFDPVVTTFSELPMAVAVPNMLPEPEPEAIDLADCTPEDWLKLLEAELMFDEVTTPLMAVRLPLASRIEGLTGAVSCAPVMP